MGHSGSQWGNRGNPQDIREVYESNFKGEQWAVLHRGESKIVPFSVKATKDSKNPMVFNLSKPNLLEAQDPKAHVNKSYVTTQKL